MIHAPRVLIPLLVRLLTGHPDAMQLARAGAEYQVPPSVMWSVAYEETRHNLNPLVMSVRGAIGRGQINPRVWDGVGPCVHLTRYNHNIQCMAYVLRWYRDHRDSWHEAAEGYCGTGPDAWTYAYNVTERRPSYALAEALVQS